MRPSTDDTWPTVGQWSDRLHISPSKIIRRASIGQTISSQRLGCSRLPNVGRTLACQLRRLTNHADHVPTLGQRLVADWVRLSSQSNKISVPKLYYYGPRRLNVILTQLRCTASFLNQDLCKVHILSSSVCRCGAPKKMRTTSFLFVPNILK